MHVPDVGQYLIAKDVYTIVGYDKENGVKTMQRLVPEKYKMGLGESMMGMKEVDKNVHLHPDTVLLKEPGLYCFLLRCKRDEAEPFMGWAVETVLPREVRKLASTIEGKDAALAHRGDQIEALEFTNEEERQAHQQEILRLNGEINDLIANSHVARRGCFDKVLCFIKQNCREVLPYYVIRCQYRQLEKHKRWLKLCYPNMEVADDCDDPNAIHRWCRFKCEVIKKPNYHKNHFKLTEDKQTLLETALDVTI